MTVAGVTITHPERAVYPESGLTKLQLAEFYEAVAPLMLPHIKARPISSVRCPDGIGGACFASKLYSVYTHAQFYKHMLLLSVYFK